MTRLWLAYDSSAQDYVNMGRDRRIGIYCCIFCQGERRLSFLEGAHALTFPWQRANIHIIDEGNSYGQGKKLH